NRIGFSFHKNHLDIWYSREILFLTKPNNLRSDCAMYAAVINEFGQAPEYRQVPEPEAPDGQVLAQARAAAIKNIERMLVDGAHDGSAQMSRPAQVGLDAVAVLPDGRRVYTGSAPPAGPMAEFIAVDPHHVIELPDDVDDAQAAAMPNAALSAWFA